MDIQALSPYVRIALDSRIPHPWHMQERVIFDWELLYVKKGEVLFTIGADRFIGRSGDLVLFKPGQPHSLRTLKGPVFHQPHLHFDLFYQADSPDVKVSFKPLDQLREHERKWLREDVTSQPGLRMPNRIPLRNPRYFEALLYGIIREFDNKLPHAEIAVKGLFLGLWAYLMRECHWSAQEGLQARYQEQTRIKEHLDSRVNTEVTLDDLASAFNLSKHHLARQFRDAFGVSPIHYHRERRIQKAKEMVQYSNRSLSDIAELHGFNSLHAFSRCFRAMEGVPPSFYRRIQTENEKGDISYPTVD